MNDFREIYNSLINKIDGNINLSSVLEFCTYFRCDDIDLYNEFLSDYAEVGHYNTSKLLNLYCKSKNIELSDENARNIFLELVDNIWNNGMSYHLTTSISALNIYENGMDPSKKEIEVVEDINSLMSSLSDDGRRNFFPFAIGDINMYSYSSIPKLNVNYGMAPEWYLNLIGYQKGSFEEIIPNILKEMSNESLEAREKMFLVVSKYHDLYKNSSRTLVIIPDLNKKLSEERLDSFGVNNVDKLNVGIEYFLSNRRRNIDAKSNKIVPSSELMFIDVKTRNIVNFEDRDKKI